MSSRHRGARVARQPRREGGRTFEGSWLRQALVWLVTLKVVGLVLIFDPRGLNAFDLPKSSFSRAMEWLLLAALVLALTRYGPAIVPRTRLHLAVLAFVAANVVAAAFAENRYVALYGEYGRFVGLTFVVDMAVLYAAVAVAFRGSRDWLVFGGGLTFALIAAVAYAAIQRAGRDPIRWLDESQARPFSTLGNPDMFAEFLAGSIGAALGVALFPAMPGALAQGIRVGAMLAAFAGVATTAVVATRGSAIGLGAVVALLPVVYVRVLGLNRITLVRTVVVTAVGAAVLVAMLSVSPLGARVLAASQGIQLADRLTIYRSAFDAFLARPLTGYGPDNFAVLYARHRAPESSRILGGVTLVTSAHSWLLQAVSTTGIVGLAALLALLLAFAWSAWRELRRSPWLIAPVALAAVGYYTTALVSPSAVMVDWIPWVCFGAIASVAAAGPPIVVRNVPSRPVEVLAVSVSLLAVLGIALGGNAMNANLAANAARWTADVDSGIAAVRMDGGRARYWNLLGYSYAERSQWRESAEAYEEAAARAPYNASYWANLSASRLRQGTSGVARARAAALEAGERAVQADPNNLVGHVALAQVANALGNHGLALRELLAATRLNPRDTSYDYDRLTAEAALRDADVLGARSVLEEMLTLKESATLRLALAQLAMRLNDRVAARAHVQRALELEPNNAEAKQLLAAMTSD